jgi:hypothetical protein
VHKHLFNNGTLSTSANVARWNARVAELDRAMVGESARWADYRRANAYRREVEWASNNNWIVSTYFPSNAAIGLKRFQDANLYPTLGAPNFSQFGGNVAASYQLGITHTNAAGTVYYTTDGSDPRSPGGAVSGSASAYSQPISLISPTLVRARVRNATTWSALVEARFTTPQDFSKLLLSELHYNPPMSNNVDGEEFEFVELQNIGTNTLDLGGLSFTQGINFTFTNETLLAPGAFFVLVRNPAQFSARFPTAPVHGVYSGKLDNGGETIRLSGPLGTTIFSLTYDDVLPWPVDADGSGFSLQRVNYAPDLNAAANWTAALPTPGSVLPVELFDTDADGMPDVWEDAHGFNWLVAGDATEDADDDGSTNVSEFRAGTNPRNADDYLRLLASVPNNTVQTLVLKFHAATNRSYSVVSRPLPDQGCWTLVTNIPASATSREVFVTNSTASNGARFYRLLTPSSVPACP